MWNGAFFFHIFYKTKSLKKRVHKVVGENSLLRYGAVRKKGHFLMNEEYVETDEAGIACSKFNNYIIIMTRSIICK